ncbi:MAG: hypothetical protein KDC61_02375 [Saprospiraceae bacterium]|nr:hypothetical protein [Saprospiraceae bacterium]
MNHFVGKTYIELHLHGIPADAAFDWQQQAEHFCYDHLLPALDTLFDRLAGPNEVLTIDKLDIELRNIPAGQWEEKVLRQVLETVENQIRKRLLSPLLEERIERHPVALSHFSQWLYFLEHGSLPPGQAPAPEEILKKAALETVAAQSRALQRFLDLLRRKPHALRRLLWQYDDIFLDALLEASAGSGGTQLIAMRIEAETLMKAPPKRSQQFDFEKIKSINFETLLRDFRQIFRERTWAALTESRFEPVQILLQTLKALYLRQLPNTSVRSAYILFLTKQTESHPIRFGAVAPIITQLQNDLKIAGALHNEPFKKEKNQSDEMPTESQTDDLTETKDISSSEKITAQTAPPETPQSEILKPETPKPESNRPETLKPETPKPENNLPETLKPEILQPAKTGNSDWYVSNAGIVLLHPFLPTLFQTLGLTNEGQFDTAEKRQQAVYLLHYIATGQTDTPEFDLVFPKFLCDWDIEAPLDRNWKIEIGNWEEEVETLLRAAIKNWGKLGNASAEGLRESFLMRPGKLSSRPFDGWQLRLEPSGIDLLLNYLPWTISIVKLPWMKEILNVEWTS